MKKRSARAITYSVMALLLVVALRYTPEVPDKPVADVMQQGDLAAPAPRPWSRVETLNRGETLIGLLKRIGVSDHSAQEVVRAATASAVNTRYLRAGMPVELTSESQGQSPSELVFHLGVDRLLRMKRSDAGWVGNEERLPWTIDTVVVGGTIRANLYQAMDSSTKAFFPGHATDELAWALADIFEYRVDMSRDLQSGDSFHALIERGVAPSGATKVSKVLAASFSLSGSEMAAVRFDTDDGAQYYDATGKSMRAAFLRAPLEFRRISSTFGMRFHPILGRWKAHKGTDYSARGGTPIRAVGNAVVVRAGWSNGYGNLIELRHPNGFVTRYGHMRAFANGVRSGTRVVIGQTIGFVGATGLATAPHLHFEVLVGGAQRDSRTALKSIGGDPIRSNQRVAFDSRRSELLSMLSGNAGVVRLAQR